MFWALTDIFTYELVVERIKKIGKRVFSSNQFTKYWKQISTLILILIYQCI